MSKTMTRGSVYKKTQEEKEAKEKAEQALKPILPKVDEEYEFVKDANLHWIGKSFRTGDRTKDLTEEDINKLSLTNHIKKV
jgi:hypothetical protein